MFGLLPPGDELVSADYSVDGGSPVSKALDALPGESLPIGNTTYFKSPALNMGSHNLTIRVTNTSLTRNYTLDYFDVATPIPVANTATAFSVKAGDAGVKVGVVIAGVLCAFILGVLMAFAFQWVRRRRSKSSGDIEAKEKTRDVESDIVPEIGAFYLVEF